MKQIQYYEKTLKELNECNLVDSKSTPSISTISANNINYRSLSIINTFNSIPTDTSQDTQLNNTYSKSKFQTFSRRFKNQSLSFIKYNINNELTKSSSIYAYIDATSTSSQHSSVRIKDVNDEFSSPSLIHWQKMKDKCQSVSSAFLWI